MIVVRRMDANRPPQYHRPMKKTMPPSTKAAVTCQASSPPTSAWSEAPASGVRMSWKSVCEVYRPRAALSAIQVGASSQTRDRPRMRR